ncbi:MAG: flagellar hook-basal body complex protein FliE [Planctomycetes bacterium]|nr:flagellar hook-basal body complex protein FliE [Planctomycetota bacterium]
MSGFDLPPIRGLDQSLQGLQQPQRPFASPEVLGDQDPFGGTQPGGGVDKATPFSGVLADSLGTVRGLQLDVKDKVRGMVMGEDVELHDVMIAGSKSEVAFNLLLEVRNKMIDAWEKLSRSSA